MAYRTVLTAKAGQTIAYYGAGVTTVGLFLGNWLPHTYLLGKYKDIFQHYSEGVGLKVDDDVMALTQEVMDTMKMSEGKKDNVHFFTVFGFDLFHAGSLMLRSGAEIGLPITFGNSEDKLNKTKRHIIINNKPLNWGKPAGESLISSMILSKDAQKFAIARELSHVEMSYVYWNSILPSTLAIATFGIGQWLSTKLKLLKKPFGLRLLFYTIMGFQGVAFWAIMKDGLTCFDEGRADREACALGESYARGAVEFYQKLLKRNIALRELDKSFEKYYTAYGNEHVTFRTKHIPLVNRLQDVTELLKQQQQQQEISEETKDVESLNTI